MTEVQLLFRHNGLYLKRIPDKSRGVFCREDVKAGETLEVAPVIIYDGEDAEHLTKTRVADYCFSAKNLSDRIYSWENIKTPDRAACLAMGITSFCNHLIKPNAVAEKLEDTNILYYTLKAIEDIPRDTEICISYGHTWFASRRINRKAKA